VTTSIRRASKANLKAVFGAEFSEEKSRKEQGRPKKAPGNAGVGGGLTNRSRTERNMLAKSRGWEETVVYTRLYSIKLVHLQHMKVLTEQVIAKPNTHNTSCRWPVAFREASLVHGWYGR
jgi:hypothetical protein